MDVDQTGSLEGKHAILTISSQAFITRLSGTYMLSCEPKRQVHDRLTWIKITYKVVIAFSGSQYCQNLTKQGECQQLAWVGQAYQVATGG